MSEVRRFDGLEKVVKDTARRLEDTRSTTLARIATHTHPVGDQVNVGGSDSSAAFTAKVATTSDDVLTAQISGEAGVRFLVEGDGTIAWGDGSSFTLDTSLARSAAGTLAVGGDLDVSGTFTAGGSAKTFVIDHPSDSDRYLIHATTESPVNGVEYWGTAEIESGRAEVVLPAYFEGLCSADNRQVQVSLVLPDEDNGTPVFHQVAASAPKDGKFRIACSGPDGTRVAWLVKAVRQDVPPLLVEPLKTDVTVHGDGPYRYYTLGG